jgi:hypothetical protein
MGVGWNWPQAGWGTSVVSPASFDESLTLYEQVAMLRQRMQTVIDQINSFDSDGLISEIDTKLKVALDTVAQELAETLDAVAFMIESVQNSQIAYDPTNGKRTESIDYVLNHVFDNARVFAYFAKQYDDKQLTSAQYDALNLTARQYDMAPDYYGTQHAIYATEQQVGQVTP